jgi:hypothetical protein
MMFRRYCCNPKDTFTARPLNYLFRITDRSLVYGNNPGKKEIIAMWPLPAQGKPPAARGCRSSPGRVLGRCGGSLVVDSWRKLAWRGAQVGRRRGVPGAAAAAVRARRCRVPAEEQRCGGDEEGTGFVWWRIESRAASRRWLWCWCGTERRRRAMERRRRSACLGSTAHPHEARPGERGEDGLTWARPQGL